MQKILNKSNPNLLHHLLKFSAEIECLSKNPPERIYRKMIDNFGQFATDKKHNNGNGWNDDIHRDSSVPDGCGHNEGYPGDFIPREYTRYHSLEMSTSPLKATTFEEMVEELTMLLSRLEVATGGTYPTVYGSTHIHCTMLYDEHGSLVDKTNSQELTNYIAKFIRAYFPAIRLLGAYTIPTVVRNHGRWSNDYSYTTNDSLWLWQSNNYRGNRGSLLRTEYQNNADHDVFHVEFRGSDSCQDPVLIALQMATYKAIVLYCANCIKFGVAPEFNKELTHESFNLTGCLKDGIFDNMVKNKIKTIGEDMVSRLAPFFKVMDSPEVTNILLKFYNKPAIEILREEGRANAWDKVSSYLLGRKRNRNEEKRNAFISAVVSGAVPRAKDLNGFKENLANALGMTTREVTSLYVMLNREGYNIVFEHGRLNII